MALHSTSGVSLGLEWERRLVIERLPAAPYAATKPIMQWHQASVLDLTLFLFRLTMASLIMSVVWVVIGFFLAFGLLLLQIRL